MPPSKDLQRKLQVLVQTGLLLAKHSNLETILQATIDAGAELCDARFGAFLYNVIDAKGESSLLYALSGTAREQVANVPIRRNTATFCMEGIVRSDDITQDARFGRDELYVGTPIGHLPTRSYLAVPVVAPSGEVLGGLFYGHEAPGVFGQEEEELVASVAAQAAVAIENARLRAKHNERILTAENGQLRQREVAKQLSEIAAIISSSDDAIIGKDLTGTIRSWNPAATQIFGYAADEMIGQSILRLIPEELQYEEHGILAKIRAAVKIEHFETVRITKTGKRIDVSLSISPIFDESGTIIGASKVLRDVTAKRLAETSLIQAEKMAAAGRMAASIAHEINNPLEAITNLIFLAKSNADKPDEVRDFLSQAEGEVARVSRLAKQTLGFYREHAAPVKTTFEELITEAVSVYERKCSELGITVQLDLHARKPLTVRKGEMTQVISNLVANAIYAMPSGGTLSVATNDAKAEEADGILLTVADTGVGIAEEHRARIFEAFFTTRSAIGTGIGLFVAKQFVEEHHGTIRVESSTDIDAHGTKFFIFLPRLPTPID